jgi:MFS family permease
MNIRELLSPLTGNLLVLVVSLLGMTFTSEMVQPYKPLYIFALGGTGAVIGIISATQTLLGTFFRVPGGYIADVYGRSRLPRIVTSITSFAYFLYIFAPH